MRVESIYISPVKSLALQRVERAQLEPYGFAGDRRFYVISDRNRLVSQRECGALALVRAQLRLEPEQLELTFPDSTVASGAPEDGEAVTARFFGSIDVPGTLVRGPWPEALSSFAGMPLRLVRAAPGRGFDALAVSICSTASLDALRRHAGDAALDERRFRQNVIVAGCERPHQEDEWIGRSVAIGAAVVRVEMRDSRCEMTTRNPDTGLRDADTLKWIAAYRTDQPKAVNFGVYATVETSAEIAVGDEVRER